MTAKQTASDWLVQVDIGLAALEAGFIAPDEFMHVFKQIYGDDKPKTADEVWVDSGRLSKDQLEIVLLASQFNKDTSPVASTITQHHTVRVSGTMSAVGPRLGKVVTTPDAADRYLRLRALGKGGMGEITECLDNRLGRKVAVKTIRNTLVDDPEVRVMLEREARVTGNLEHPGIVPVHDLGLHPSLGTYYVMRRLEQPTLAAVLSPLKKYERGDGHYTLGRLLRHFVQICEVAEYAHSQGIIHCDLKPANILIGTYGEVMVLDWGMAFRKDKGTGYRGGTPGYMAPEQAGHDSVVDERTDVYALGAILYEIVALATPYDIGDVVRHDTEGDKVPRIPTKPPPLPSQRARPGRVPPELDDVCMKALALDPAERYGTAKKLAAAVEAFLEGTAERERRQLRADDMTQMGDMLAANYHDFVDSRPERVDELDQVRKTIPSWETSGAKQALWDAEDRLEVMDALGVRMLHSAVAAYEQALDEVSTHPAARLGLARLYLAEYRRAMERRDDIARVYFEELINQYDDGSVRREMNADGFVTIHSTPQAQVTLSRVEQRARRLIASQTVDFSTTPTSRLRLLPGSYLAQLRTGKDQIQYPIRIRSEQEISIAVDLAPAAKLGPREIFVPGGLSEIGGDEEGLDLRTVDIGSFVMGMYPVTFAEYFELLVDLARMDPATATRHVPRSSNGEPFWRWSATESKFEPTTADTLGYSHEAFLALPAFGIDATSATAYTKWMSERTGSRYRLPTELEWERAGRGADGRLFPWGDRFDASFCKMRESSPGLPKPEPSGHFAEDTSPFGVRDLAGGVAEWVLPVDHMDGDRMMTRGGAWCDFANDCRLTARRLYLAVEFSARIGFRIARDV